MYYIPSGFILASDCFTRDFPTNIPYVFLISLCPLCPVHSNFSLTTLKQVKCVNSFFQSPLHLVGSKCFPEHFIFKHLQFMLFTQSKTPTFTVADKKSPCINKLRQGEKWTFNQNLQQEGSDSHLTSATSVWKLWKLTVTKATLISDQITVKTHKRLNVSL